MKWFTCFLALLAGCGMGDSPMWSKANPQFRAKVDPLSKTFSVFDSMDRSWKIAKVSGKSSGGTEFLMEGLEVIGSASNVRDADSRQIAETTKLTDSIGSIVTGLSNIWAPRVDHAIDASVAKRELKAQIDLANPDLRFVIKELIAEEIRKVTPTNKDPGDMGFNSLPK